MSDFVADNQRPASTVTPTPVDPGAEPPATDAVLSDPVGAAARVVPDTAPLLPDATSDADAVEREMVAREVVGDPVEPAEPPITVGGMTVPPPEEPTVGTGSIIALGCGAGTIVFVIFVIVIAFWLR